MAEKSIQKKQKTELVAEDGSFRDFVDMAANMSDKPFTESRCKLCTSSLRADAEKEWERVHNYAAVYRWLNTEKKFEISEAAVKVHLRDHYAKEIRNRQLSEYAIDLSENWFKIRQSSEDRITGYLALIDMRIHTLAAATDKHDPEAMRKTNDSIAKLVEQACKLEERLQNMKEASEPANILIDKFKNVILVQMQNIKSPETKQVLMQILEAVNSEVGEVEIDG